MTPKRSIVELDDPVELEFPEEADPFVQIETGVADTADYDPHIAIDAIHDGWIIPDRFVAGFTADERRQLVRTHEIERDWGASWVAAALSRRLAVRGCYQVRIARALLDFNRFPGASTGDADHLGRLAINPPFTEHLSFAQKAEVLADYYDPISKGMEQVIGDRLVKLAVHTYDPHNESGTERPAVSLVNRPESYQLRATLPWGTFDRLFPTILGEFMASRVLTYRIALSLEKRNVPVALNFPYLLPDGSVELRSQVWYFFHHLKIRFGADNDVTDDETASAFALTWDMLMDTNARSSASLAFREYVHAFRRAPAGLESFFDRGRSAYEDISDFLTKNWKELVENYRHSPTRPSSLAIEIRKDYLWEFENGRPTRLNLDAAEEAVQGIADGVERFFRTDIDLEHLTPRG